jgi:hypothetical protein
MGVLDTVGSFLGDNAGSLGQIAGTGAQLYGQQNAAEAVEKANTAAAGTQAQYLGTAGGYYQPYLGLGSGAASALGRALGTNGQPADYSGFMNMPGYQFAIQQGQQAAERQAAAMGNAGNSGTAAMIGNQVAGTAMQDYNNYIQQLQGAAGLGATSADQIGNLTYKTGANISQLQGNTGQSQAGMYTGMGQTVGGALNPLGYNTSGAAGGGGSGLIGAIGNIAKGIGGWFGGGSGSASTGSTDPGTYGSVGSDSQGGFIQNNDQYGGQDIGWAPEWDSGGG